MLTPLNSLLSTEPATKILAADYTRTEIFMHRKFHLATEQDILEEHKQTKTQLTISVIPVGCTSTRVEGS